VNVWADAWPLTVVPMPGVSLIVFGAGWLIVTPTEPSSVSVRLPSVRLALMLAGTMRPSSASMPGRKRFGARAGVAGRRLRRPNSLRMNVGADIFNLLKERKN
jgi:hypothetical protein